MVLVFDLDDTLYDEVTFVESGFKAVSGFLSTTYSIPAEDSFLFMMDRQKNGRGRIFNDTLTHYGCYSSKLVEKCISVYRKHKPKIKLTVDADNCLERFKSAPKYIVTDGNKLVQHNKVAALGLYKKVNRCFITHRFGLKNAKPSPYCFLKICEHEKVEPDQVVYIGDDPNKDFVGIRPLGFKTIRILRGRFKDLKMPRDYEADYKISFLDELDQALSGLGLS